jgi:predicted peptidase
LRIASVLCVLALAITLAMAPRSAASSKQTGFLDRTISLNGATYKYQIFVPETWSAREKWPVILFLHGAGERGSDGLLQTDVGIAHAMRKDRSRFPAIVVMPQCPKESWWTEPQMEEMALAALAAATKEFKGDMRRTYLTGLSMGGYGTWDMASRYPGKFAAIVPICGGIVPPERVVRDHPDLKKDPYPQPSDVAKKIGRTPVWIFHGGDDPLVPVTESRNMAEAMKNVLGQSKVYSAPGKTPDNRPEVVYVEYKGVGHNSWDLAYEEPQLMPWLLSWSLPK